MRSVWLGGNLGLYSAFMGPGVRKWWCWGAQNSPKKALFICFKPKTKCFPACLEPTENELAVRPYKRSSYRVVTRFVEGCLTSEPHLSSLGPGFCEPPWGSRF